LIKLPMTLRPERTVKLVTTPHDTPLDRSSLLWRWAGDMRIAFEGGTAGLLQTMHPAIGYGLIEHSNFFDDPVDRVFRSLPGILGTVYRTDGATTGIAVRDYHRDIKGEMPGGQHYHALNPRTYWWAHATFQRMVDRVATYWDTYALTDTDFEQLYAEGCIWYRRYGVSDAPLPPDRPAFEAEFERYCTDVLEPNPASDYLISFIKRRTVPNMAASPYFPAPPGLSAVTDRLLPMSATRAALAPPMQLTIFGGLPEVVRERFKIRWTRTNERAYRAMRAAIRRSWPLIPRSWRWHQEARTGWRRA